MKVQNAIGVFDSGFGGLTVFKSIEKLLPQYNFIYLGDNARSPYGDHSFETVYQYTLEAVEWLFAQGCPLVILACNTASAKALRSIQQKDLPIKHPNKRVLGVIRPTAEIIGRLTKSNAIGVFGTRGTIRSGSYPIEIGHFYPDVKVYQQSCPMWVPLIENGEHNKPGADYFVAAYINALKLQCDQIDTLLLACTHYPLLASKIAQYVSEDVKIVSQGDVVAERLLDYLRRHPEIDTKIDKLGNQSFNTTGDIESFNSHASVFLDRAVYANKVKL